jgi:hypothetical protein
VDSTRPLAVEKSMIRIEQLLLDMPIEVELRMTAQGLKFLSDVPNWRWRTVFDQEPGRLKIRCGDLLIDDLRSGDLRSDDQGALA